ncbi:MAG: hypothetical protein HOM25_01220 [Rhodospirillaceae bacterium]|nr:hypothetical protein [Rhodospirillaceae bacterium]
MTAWVFRTQIAATIAIAALKNNGYPSASMSVIRLGFHRATVATLVLSPNLRASKIEATYTLNGILSKQLESLHVTGFYFDSTPSTTSPDGAFQIPLIEIPVDRLRVTGSRATLQTTSGGVDIDFSGDLTRRDDDASDLQLSATIKSGGAEAAFHTNGIVTTIPLQSLEITAAINGAVHSADVQVSFDGAIDGLHLVSGETFARVSIANAVMTTAARQASLSRLSAQVIHRPDSALEIDVTGMLHGDEIPPETKFSLALNAPKPVGQAPAEFHAVLDSTLGWGQLDGHIDPDWRINATASGAYEPDGETAAHVTGAIKGRLGEDAAFSLSGVVAPDWALSMGIPDASAAGEIAFTVNGGIPLTAALVDPNALSRTAYLAGRIDLDLTDADIPGLLTAKATSGALTFDAHDNAIDIALVQGLDVQGLTLTPELAPSSVRRLLNDSLSLGAPPSRPIRIENAFNNPILLLPDSLNLKTPKSSAALPKGATLRFNPDLSFAEADFPHVTFHTNDAIVNGGAPLHLIRASVTGSLENLHLSPGNASGQFRVSGAAPIVQAPVTAHAHASLSGSFKRDGSHISITADPDSSLGVSDIAINGIALSNAPITLSPDGAASLSIDLSQASPRIAYVARLKPVEALLIVPMAGVPTTIGVAIPNIEASGSTASHSVQLGGGSLRLPAYDLSLNGVDMRADIGLNTTASLSIAAIENLSDAPWFIPLKLKASAAIKDGVATFKGRLDDTPGNIVIDANGRHNFAKKTGNAAIKAKKITFLPTVLQPDALSPRLRHMFREVDGDIALQSTLSWRDGALRSGAEALVNLARLETDEVNVTNAAAILTFDNLFPPTTPPGQIVEVGEIDLGVPLTDGRLALHLRADGSVLAGLEKFNLFGGRIETTPFVLPRTFDNFTIPLAVTGIRLADLLAVAKFGDLTATGALDGSIPVTITGGEFAVRDGLLKTVAGGSLRYRPRAIGPALSEANEGAALFLDLVKDFSYDEIQVTLNEGEFEQIAFGFKIKGHNKTVYNGVPVDLNVTLTGPLRKILQQGHETFTTPAWLKERIAEFEQKQPNR